MAEAVKYYALSANYMAPDMTLLSLKKAAKLQRTGRLESLVILFSDYGYGRR